MGSNCVPFAWSVVITRCVCVHTYCAGAARCRPSSCGQARLARHTLVQGTVPQREKHIGLMYLRSLPRPHASLPWACVGMFRKCHGGRGQETSWLGAVQWLAYMVCVAMAERMVTIRRMFWS